MTERERESVTERARFKETKREKESDKAKERERDIFFNTGRTGWKVESEDFHGECRDRKSVV